MTSLGNLDLHYGAMRLGRLAMCLLGMAVAMAESARAEPAAAPVADPPVAEIGLPFIRNFDPSEYRASSQNWAIAQDLDGVIYVGNNEDGVLAFDGTTWRRIAIPNLSVVRALAADGTGRIYVGAVGELGYLAPDASGATRYTSLLERIPVEERDFADVWQVFPTDAGVYFSTDTRLFRLSGDQVAVWKSASSFHMTFLCRDTLFIREVDRGLLQLAGDKLVPVPGGERFAIEKVYAMLPWGDTNGGTAGELLIGTRTQGWFVFDGVGYRPWVSGADNALRRDLIYGAIRLADGTLAVATLQGGVSLLDDHGRLLRHLTKANGLINDAVYALFEDRQRGLWLGLDTGIARIDMGSPISRYDERTGLEGSVFALERHAGRLYAGTLNGMFRLDTDAEGLARFAPIAQVPGQTWAFLDLGRSLLAATAEGVFEMRDGGVRRVRPSEQASGALLRSRQQPSRVFVGLQDGLASMRLENDRWVDEGRIPGITDDTTTLFEDADGRLWLGNWNGGVIRIDFPRDWTVAEQSGAAPRVERFGIAHGLPIGSNAVYPIDGMVRFTSESGGLFQFDESRQGFVPDLRFADLFPSGLRQVARGQQDASGRIWMATADRFRGVKEIGAAVKDNAGAYRWAPTPLQPISGNDFYAIHGDRDGVMWFGGAQGLFRYDPGKRVADDPRYTALVRSVTGKDGLPVGGGTRPSAVPQIVYANNALRVEFAAPSYDSLEANRFQVFLEGLDPHWSAWSDESYRDYNSLAEGDYRFRVRARNVYGVVSTEYSYAFGILPPWYRTWWAYLGFATLSVTTLWLVYRWRLSELHAHNELLQERNRLGLELHDIVAQLITALSLQLDAARHAVGSVTGGDAVRAFIDRASQLARASFEETRLTIRELRSERPDESLSQGLDRVSQSMTEGTEIRMTWQHEGTAVELSGIVRHALCRVAQEAITNAARHGRAKRIDGFVRYCADGVRLAINDNGIGFDPSAKHSEGPQGLGITGMVHRIASLDGRLEVRSRPGEGTVVEAFVPRHRLR